MNYPELDEMQAAFTKNDTLRDQGLKEPEQLIKHRNLCYGPYGIENRLDIYYPTNTTHALPTIVSIHGGGFFYGDKERYRFYTMFLATQGFTVVNVNYRLAPTHRYPAPLEDINQVMNWLVIHAPTYFVDLDHLFLLGDSAGGQLVEQYAAIISNPAYGALFAFTPASVTFKALALNCGVYFMEPGRTDELNFSYYFPETITPTIQAQFPVEQFLTANYPPTFVMTARHDFLKDLAQPLVDQLKQQHVQTVYHLYEPTDGARLEHVFHIDQKSSYAKTCNLDEVHFFQTFCH